MEIAARTNGHAKPRRRAGRQSAFTKPQFRAKIFLKIGVLPGDAPGIGGSMKRFAAFLSLLRTLFANCAAGEEKMRPMEIIDSILMNLAIRRFLEKRGILTEDKEAYNYTNAFLTAAVDARIPHCPALHLPRRLGARQHRSVVALHHRRRRGHERRPLSGRPHGSRGHFLRRSPLEMTQTRRFSL